MSGILVAPTFVAMTNLRDVNDAAKADQYGLLWDAGTAKHVYVALLTGSASDYVQVDGSNPLTANWDAGSFQIRAETFQSDIATGTAPLTVASTTLVTNLNADKLDGQEGSYYQDAGNLNAGTLADARVAESNVTQHEAALTITESQISDLGTYATQAEVTAITSGYSRRQGVIARVDNTAAPPTEVNGDRYLLDATGASHGDWDGAAANDIVQFTGSTWAATTPVEGWITYSDGSDTDWLFIDDGSPAWQERTAGGGVTDHGALTGLADDDHTQYLLGDGTRAGTGIQELKGLNLTDATELTISSGAITVTQGYHTVDTESDAASDDLDTITAAKGQGDIIILRPASSARTIVIKHETGNIKCVGNCDITLDDDHDCCQLVRIDGTTWAATPHGSLLYCEDSTLGTAAGDIIYRPTANTHWVNLPKGTDGEVLTLASGLPSWAPAGSGISIESHGIAGRWARQPALLDVTVSTSAAAADLLYAVPFIVPKTTTYDRIGVVVATAAVGKTVRLGIYSDSDGLPGALALDGGTVSVGSTGLASVTISKELTAGRYHLAILGDGAPGLDAIAPAELLSHYGFDSLLSSGVAAVMLARSFTYGALPDPYGTHTALATLNAFVVGMRVA
jgi:hypothetical protein